MTHEPLTDRAIRILDFEREWWTYAGDKATGIKTEFDLDPDTYQAELDRIIFTDAALAHDRMLVKRLRRLSAQRRRQAAHGGGAA